MKKAVKINLSGQIFHIDDDAYDKLKIYLDTISSHFSNVNESKEILSDIESRIAELFQERMSNENQVISIKEVDEVIDIMGRPEEIADEDEPTTSHRSRENRGSRRLYRDPENAVFGGVSAGLSAYFNLDVLLIRILFVVLTLIGAGTPFLLYIILWIAVPKAETPAEKLEMRGEKVTVSNIEKTVRDEYEEVKQNLNRARNSESFKRTEDTFTRIFGVLGSIIVVFFKVIVGFIAFGLILMGISLLFGTVGFVFFGAHFLPFGPNGTINHTFPEIIEPFVNPSNASALILAAMLLLLIPILAIIYGLFKALFRFKGKDKVLGMGAFTLWILALIAVIMIFYYEGRNYQDRDMVTDSRSLAPFTGDTLYLSLNKSEIARMDNENNFNFDHKWYFSDDLDSFSGDIDINVRKSSDSEYKLRIEKTARGIDNETAAKFAQKIEYSYTQNGENLVLNPYYELEKESPWRAQSVEVTVYVPVGKYVILDKNTEDFLGWVQNTEDISEWEVVGKTMLMKEEGLSFAK